MDKRRYFIELASPETRLPPEGIRGVVIHTSQEFVENTKSPNGISHVKDLWAEMGIGPHYMVHPSGTVEQVCSLTDMAYHARGFNFVTIGIEVLIPGFGSYIEFLDRTMKEEISSIQMNGLYLVLEYLYSDDGYSKNETILVGHYEISPERKRDPGNYIDMDSLRRDFEQDKWNGKTTEQYRNYLLYGKV